MKQLKVSVIGFGNVGSVLSTLLLQHPHPIRLNIMEPDTQKRGAFLDIYHAIHLFSNKTLTINDENELIDADFIFYSAGVQNIHGKGRLSTIEANKKITSSIFEGLKFTKTPFIIVITNPVDIISYHVHKITQLPSDRVIGTGTFLDSSRMNYYLSLESGVPSSEIDALVLGEHGDSQVPIFSACTVNGKSILGHPSFPSAVRQKVTELTKNAAFEIRETQDGTSYGVAKCAEYLFDQLVNDLPFEGPLSVLPDNFYTSLLNLEKPIYISLPVQLTNQGVRYKHLSHFTDSELNALKESASILKQNIGE